ncbi:hypothetical protein [Rhizorhabdus dicambivorans]|uniref:Uncharacterized protein n=1 Tax=Rhizorhabdus dicambivorans TaxID=1850238 RepID=A0A2A4FZF9_9SPHN|nr:hypothetical protein [Rhizorhabdus dicambivorans]ATE65995.1 hypothetical protein CMV14_17595 [Rhizorhabdus dicambivorans]PCE43112.1 hypothetical protein COO09_07380 [Rhizorhabdus dicambivorans]
MHSDMITRDHLSVLIARRDIIEAVMARHLAGQRASGATDEERAATHSFVDIVLAAMEGNPPSRALEDPLLRRYASAFGDGLAAVLKDVIGGEVPGAFIARCVDRFWAGLRPAAA